MEIQTYRYLRSYGDGYFIYYKEPSEKAAEQTCSEAHGYGMLISVLKRNQQDFDGLYRYFNQWKNHKGLMQWQQKTTSHGQFVPGDEGGDHCATDGDVDIATALFLAAKVWGRGGAQGEIDYRAAAVNLARSIWDHCFNHETYMPLIGDWADPGDEAFALTRPSDFILSGYLLFYYEDTERQQIWGNVVNAIVNTCQGQLAMNPQTGLIADFLTLDPRTRAYNPVHKEVLESKHDPDYNWNSCRVPWRLGHYYMLSKDPRIRQLLETQANFFAHQLSRNSGDCPIRAGYHLNGQPYADYSDMAFTAPVSFLFWVLDWRQQLDQVMRYIDEDNECTYFGESIAMLAILVFITIVLAKDLLTLTSPTPNQSVTPGHLLSFNYTMNAIFTNSQQQQQQQVVLGYTPNYPNALDVYFQWTAKNDSQHMIQFTAAKGLITDSVSTKDMVYDHVWRLPSCRFFKRYQPDQWNFNLLFQPIYAEPSNSTTNIPLGPQQSSMTMPINISVNNMTDSAAVGKGSHHRHRQEC
ncbi:hypothetical protein G6F55_004036 [Rhizopus delemar]|nr:hypothetical protein G6F55_004036 [Rhizopus delemar]KAG1523411.1 hypothetical protein G6F52_005048 [Rhizopus delemar]